MSLLKGQSEPKPPAQKKPAPKPQAVTMRVEWPGKRKSEGLGLSFKDGFNFGMGLWIALVVGMPVVGIVAGVVLFILLTFLGGVMSAF